MNKFKKDDLVIILTGKDKGKTGKIQKVSSDRVYVENINISKKHQKPSQDNKGGIIDFSNSIHISNIMHYSEDKKIKSKVKFDLKKDSKVRVLKATNETL